MNLFEEALGRRRKERNAEQEIEADIKEQKEASKGRLKLNLGDVILAFMGLPPLVSMAKGLKEGGAAAAVAGMTGIPVLGDALNTVLKTKDMMPDMLDEAIKKTESIDFTNSKLDSLFNDIRPLDNRAKSASNPTPGFSIPTSTGGNETLNDFFRLLRSVN